MDGGKGGRNRQMSECGMDNSGRGSVLKDVKRGKFWKKVVSVLALSVFVGMVGLWVAAGSIASPERRELQGYHEGYLDGAADHGLVVTRMDLEGVPYLVVRPDGAAGPAKRGGLVRGQLEEAGLELPEYGAERGMLVLLHGRNGRKEDLLPVAERFCAVGMICVIPDLPSHGESPIETVGFGAREFERELPGRVADAARAELGLGEMPEFLWGMSMGGSFAVHACAGEPERWERMVIVASFDRLEGVVQDSLGMAGGALMPTVKKLISWRGGADVAEVNPVLVAAGISVPTLVVHGDADDLISFERGRRLYEALAGEKEFLKVEGGTHDNVLVTDAPVFREMARWFLGE